MRSAAHWFPRLSIVAVSLSLSLSLSLAGCGGAGDDKPKVVPVTGLVTLNGNPLEGATVTFVPNDPKTNACSGRTDAEGKYKLFQASNEGAVPGSYKVMVEHYTSPDGSAVKADSGMDIQQLKMQGKAKQALPPKYSDFGQTELKADVGNKPNEINFPLTTS